MRQKTIPAVGEKQVTEEIVSLTIEHGVKSITAIVMQKEGDIEAGLRVAALGQEGYEMLIETANPEWAPGKPLGEFRTTDVFAVIDILGK